MCVLLVHYVRQSYKYSRAAGAGAAGAAGATRLLTMTRRLEYLDDGSILAG